MKVLKLFILGLFFSTHHLIAQTDFRKGYVIQANGDSLVGEIDYRSDLIMSNLCRFKAADKSIKDYSPNDISSYRYIDSKYFVSRIINDKRVFLEYLIKGKVNIYFMRDVNGDHYFLDKEGVDLIEIPYVQGIKYVDNKRMEFESKKHIGILNYYLQDAPELQTKIQKIRKPDHNNLISIAEDYHNIVCDDEKCIVYQKPFPIIKIFPEISFGAINYSNYDNLNDKFYKELGLIGHIWMPRTSEKLYFRTGLIFTEIEVGRRIYKINKIPLQLEYIYPRGIFRPRIAYGINFYTKNNPPTAALNFGTNIKLTKSFFLSANSDVEFRSTMLLIPRELESYSVKLGLLSFFK